MFFDDWIELEKKRVFICHVKVFVTLKQIPYVEIL